MIAIIDYAAGNLTSVARAVSHLGFKCIVTNNIDKISQADRIIFPGVGAAGAAMHSLKHFGLDSAIKTAFASGKPILGICLGTQIIMGHSREDNVDCLGIINGDVKPFACNIEFKNGSRLKIPHMGWNRIKLREMHPVFSDLEKTDEFYFVHSFYPQPDDSKYIICTTEYGISFPSVIGFNNIIATQFHPEKSGRPGLAILNKFCTWNPC